MGIKSVVKFNTEKGLLREFGGASKQEVVIDPGDRRQASVIFTVGRIDATYGINIETTDKAYDTVMRFDVMRAFADQLSMDLPKIKIDSSGEQLTVKAQLSRNFGQVSTGTAVTFTAKIKSSGLDVGNFIPKLVKTTDLESVETLFVYDGKQLTAGEMILITASTPQAQGSPLTTVRSLTVIKK